MQAGSSTEESDMLYDELSSKLRSELAGRAADLFLRGKGERALSPPDSNTDQLQERGNDLVPLICPTPCLEPREVIIATLEALQRYLPLL